MYFNSPFELHDLIAVTENSLHIESEGIPFPSASSSMCLARKGSILGLLPSQRPFSQMGRGYLIRSSAAMIDSGMPGSSRAF